MEYTAVFLMNAKTTMQCRVISKGVNWISSRFKKIIDEDQKKSRTKNRALGTPALILEDVDKTLSTQTT
jgi:hypothetical protein